MATFGREQAPRILSIEDDQWHGPFTSARGTHFLRIARRNRGTRPTLEDTRNWLRQDWTLTKSREKVARELAILRENYRIEMPQPKPDAK